MTARSVAAVIVGVVALAGCASTTGTGSSGASGPAQAGVAYAPERPAGIGTAAGGSSTLAQAPALIVGIPSADIERSVDATYTVPAHTFLASFEGVIARAVGLGGYVVSSATQPDASGRIVSGSAALKVPAAKIADFLNGMPPAFVASAINFSSIDHTAQFVDVNARLASAHAHLAALNALLGKATSLADITNLEQQVASVQTEVDSDQGQLDVLTGSVTLATATVHMSERGSAPVPVTVANPVSTGVGSGWDNAVRVTGAVLEGAVSALPLLALVAAGLLIWRRWVRGPLGRRRTGVAE